MRGFDQQQLRDDAVTAPLIQSLIGNGIQRFSTLVGEFFRQVDERILIALWLGGAHWTTHGPRQPPWPATSASASAGPQDPCA